ncbi:MAG: thiamine-phosphate kinase [Actinobacteria bacterium]|nr:thiamine-phosphate kinase [Actinomycetota bacterium]
MRVRELGEAALIAAFSEIYRSNAKVEIGIGDDGAVVASPYQREVITTDIATEGVHFNRQWSSAYDIGAKIAIANLADVYAMGATPHYLTVAIASSGAEEVSYLLDIARGIESVASAHGASVVGGDVVAADSLTIAITAIGGVITPALRSGVKVGDYVYLTRGTGRSLGGLLLLSRGLVDADSQEVKFFQRPEFHPEDLTEFGYENMAALMDVSDGLIADLGKIAEASKVCIDLDIDEGQLEYLRDFAKKLELLPLELFLRSGEEHSFIVAVRADLQSQVPKKWIKIGQAVAGRGSQEDSGEIITMRGSKLPFTEQVWHW